MLSDSDSKVSASLLEVALYNDEQMKLKFDLLCGLEGYQTGMENDMTNSKTNTTVMINAEKSLNKGVNTRRLRLNNRPMKRFTNSYGTRPVAGPNDKLNGPVQYHQFFHSIFD